LRQARRLVELQLKTGGTGKLERLSFATQLDR
jgi:hypothetical protein